MEDGLAVLNEIHELYEELGGVDLPCSLVMVIPAASIQAEPTTEILDFKGMVIVNDTGDLEHLTSRGISIFGKNVFNVWGGALDTDIDGTPLGRSSIIVPKLRAAMNAAGGVLYNNELYQIDEYTRWIIIGQIVQGWLLVCHNKLFDTM